MGKRIVPSKVRVEALAHVEWCNAQARKMIEYAAEVYTRNRHFIDAKTEFTRNRRGMYFFTEALVALEDMYRKEGKGVQNIG